MSVDPLAADYASYSPYNYVLGNPILMTDPDGRNPIIGAIVGGVIGGGISIGTQLWNTGSVNWSTAGKSTAAGAASGAIIGTGVGAVAAIGGFAEAGAASVMITTGSGIASGIAAETVEQGWEMKIDGTRESMDGGEIATSGAIAGPLNLLGAGVAQTVKGPLTNVIKPLINDKTSKATIAQAQNTAKAGARKLGKSGKQLRPVAAAAKQDAINKTRKAAEQKVSTAVMSTTMSGNTTLKSIINSYSVPKEK